VFWDTGIEYEYQNLGPDPILWGILTVYEGFGVAPSNASLYWYIDTPCPGLENPAVSLNVDGISNPGGLKKIQALPGSTLTFNMSASASAGDEVETFLWMMSGQNETDWEYPVGWQFLQYSSEASSSCSYALGVGVSGHHYFLCYSRNKDTWMCSAPAIIHVEVVEEFQPSLPVNLAATLVAPDKVLLEWNTGGHGPGEYEIERKSSDEDGYEMIGGIYGRGPFSYEDSYDLSAATKYTYRISLWATPEPFYSNEDSVTMPGTKPAGGPVGFAAWAIARGLDPDDPYADADDDGICNLDEFFQGLNPLVPDNPVLGLKIFTPAR
jgi:hypothetical protein